MQYQAFRRSGWPIGSGMVESANKNVVETRLKGPGMHWERKNVNPMLSLRNAVCNERWTEMWQNSLKQYQAQKAFQRKVRAEQRAEALLAVCNPALLSSPSLPPQNLLILNLQDQLKLLPLPLYLSLRQLCPVPLILPLITRGFEVPHADLRLWQWAYDIRASWILALCVSTHCLQKSILLANGIRLKASKQLK